MNAKNRKRPLLWLMVGLTSAWLLALAGYGLSEHWRMTADKLRAYLTSHDLNNYSGADRARVLRELEDKINALSPEERRNARLGRLWGKWFAEMTEAEKSEFLEATLPSGFKQMLSSFEQQPPEKRRMAISNAMQNLRTAREESSEKFNSQTNQAGTNAPVMTEALQKEVAAIGLKSVYSDSSAETKAELAPLLEEVQKNMESGRMFRGGN